MTRVLEVEDLRVTFPSPGGHRFAAVDGVSFALDRGEMLALVGESGCGKSLTSLSLLRLVPPPGRIEPESRIRLGDIDVLSLEGNDLREIRGRRIGMIFQDPMTSLDPVFRVADQIAEGIRAHFPVSRREARDRAVALLREVGIPDPAARADAYPHQLSGGMRQRVMIAIALAAEPEILVADEPTTALDVTVQAQILEVLDRLRAQRGMAVLLITHGSTDPGPLPSTVPPVYPRPLRLDSPAYRPGLPAQSHSGHRATGRGVAIGLPLPPPLSARIRAVHHRSSAAAGRARAPGPVLAGRSGSEK